MQRQTILFIIAFIIILVVVLAYVARPAKPLASDPHGHESETVDQNVPQLLAAAEQAFDFGTISMKAGKVSHKFSFTNPSTTTPVTATKLFTSCMCTEASLFFGNTSVAGPFGMPGHAAIPSFRETVAPGAVGEIEVVFDPAAHGPAGIGRISREIRLETEGGAPLMLSFTANVTP